MTISPTHIPIDDWLSARYDELAQRSIRAGVTIQETRDAAVLHARLQRAIADDAGADVIPFPGKGGGHA
jgi:hypothetical protein